MMQTTMQAATDGEYTDPESMQMLYANTLYALRESRKAMLRQNGVGSESELLEKIILQEVTEHPAYDSYLSALIIEQTRTQIRAEMLALAGGTTSDDAPAICVHLILQERLLAEYADRLTEPVRMAQDALLLSFDTGLMMEVRYFSSAEYAIRWSWGEAQFCLDTAPVHPGHLSFPSHLHRDDGAVTEDNLSRPGTDCWSTFSSLLDTLLTDPLDDGSRPPAVGASPGMPE